MSGDDAERGDHGGVGRGAGSLVSDGLFSSGQCAGLRPALDWTVRPRHV